LCQLGALGSECADVWGNAVEAAQSLTQKSVGLRGARDFTATELTAMAIGDVDRRGPSDLSGVGLQSTRTPVLSRDAPRTDRVAPIVLKKSEFRQVSL